MPAKVLAAVVSLVLFLTALEFGYRLARWVKHRFSDPTRNWAVYDKDLLYRSRPDYEDSNSDGLRDDPVSPRKTVFRILMLGDSIPYYGDDIGDTYVGRLETILAQDRVFPETGGPGAGPVCPGKEPRK